METHAPYIIVGDRVRTTVLGEKPENGIVYGIEKGEGRLRDLRFLVKLDIGTIRTADSEDIVLIDPSVAVERWERIHSTEEAWKAYREEGGPLDRDTFDRLIILSRLSPGWALHNAGMSSAIFVDVARHIKVDPK